MIRKTAKCRRDLEAHSFRKGSSVLFALISIIIGWGGARVSAGESFFSDPDAPFVSVEHEQVVHLRLTPGRVEDAQVQIDAARKANPEARLVIELEGLLSVEATPLSLGSRTSLVFLPKSGISVGETCSALCLVAIEHADGVSISSSGPDPGIVDGAGKAVIGIRVTDGCRLNFDRLAIVRCAVAGMAYEGRNGEALNEAGSVTRCHFQQNGDGLRIDRTAGFLCLDNRFEAQKGTAVSVTSLNSVLAGNGFSGNAKAVQSGSDRGVITRNRIDDRVALEFSAGSRGNLFCENRGGREETSLLMAGERNQLFKNGIRGRIEQSAECKECLVMACPGIKVEPLPGVKVFNPVTFGNPHQDPVIVPGMGRFDLVVAGGKPIGSEKKADGVDLISAQNTLTKAHAEHPGDVVVLKLEGEFISRSPSGLLVPPNTCVILEGRILADLGIPIEPAWSREAPLTQVLRLPETGFCSVSGGQIDAGRQAFFPINANTGSDALIEGVTLTAGARDGIYTKGRDSSSVMFAYQCQVLLNGGRGIWNHVASRVHSIANTCSGNRMDGIDLDAECKDGTALFNICSGNRRHGVFVEEAIHHAIVFGNVLQGNGNAGVHVWNEAVTGNTGPNLIAANQCNGNRRGVSVGGRSQAITANGNLFFNNVCRGNRLNGVSSGNSCARDNYFSQIVVGQSQDLDLVPQGGGNARFLASPAAGLVEIPSIRESGIADVGVKSDQPERGFIPKFGWLLALVLMVVAFGAGSKWKRS